MRNRAFHGIQQGKFCNSARGLVWPGNWGEIDSYTSKTQFDSVCDGLETSINVPDNPRRIWCPQ